MSASVPAVEVKQARPSSEWPLTPQRVLFEHRALVEHRRHATPVRSAAVMCGVPALRSRWLDAVREMRDRLQPVLAERTGRPADSLEARLLAGAVLDAFTAAVEHWAAQDRPARPDDLLTLTRRAPAVLRLDDL